jgi:hypothetical protein
LSMTGKYDFAVLSVTDRHRDEKLNAGLIVFGNDFADVRIPKRLDKLRALSAAIDLDAMREDLLSLGQLDLDARSGVGREAKDRIRFIEMVTHFTISQPGTFEAHNSEAYEACLSRLQKLLIEPEVAVPKFVSKRTRLTTSFKSVLRGERILARKGEGLSAHRVVPNVQIAEGLAADFVLQNGAMHVFETVDASADDASLRKVVADIAVSALVIEQARMTFGETNTMARLVYEASVAVERQAQPSLMAAQHQGADLVNWASADDRRALISRLTTLAEPIPTKAQAAAAIHASTQHKFNLN